jgi:hypothetical protein
MGKHNLPPLEQVTPSEASESNVRHVQFALKTTEGLGVSAMQHLAGIQLSEEFAGLEAASESAADASKVGDFMRETKEVAIFPSIDDSGKENLPEQGIVLDFPGNSNWNGYPPDGGAA